MYVAHHILRTKIVDKALSRHLFSLTNPFTCSSELMGVQLWSEAVDFGEVQPICRIDTQMVLSKESVIFGLEHLDAEGVTSQPYGSGNIVVYTENERLAGLGGIGHQRIQ